MKKCKLVYITILAVLIFFVPSVFASGTYSGGDGLTPETAYQIATAADMQEIGANTDDWDKHFKMTADIDMLECTYITALISPDNDSIAFGYQGTPFTGSFDGNGFVINNFVIDTLGANNSYLGLIGYVGHGAVVKNISLKNGYVSGYKHIGSLVGMNNGTIDSCYSSNPIDGHYSLGSLIGSSFVGTISNCHATGDVLGTGNNLGCLSGYSRNTTISNCYATGNVTGVSSLYVGGLIGFCKSGEITNSYATGKVICSGNNAGGLIGHAGRYVNEGGSITNCFATGDVSGRDMVGGLVGDHDRYMYNSYATGSVKGSNQVGGLIGISYGEDYIDCYATGTVTGVEKVGGLVGAGSFGDFYSCYAAGSVVGSTLVGGLMGYKGQYITINDSYFLSPLDGGGPDNGAGASLTEVQMKQQSTFTNWDFVSKWWINDGHDYPKLDWQPFGDLNNDSHVNLSDIAVMSAAWGTSHDQDNYNSVCELSGDTTIGIADLVTLASRWLEGPTPRII